MTHPIPLPGDLDEPALHALVEVMFLAAIADEEMGAEERARFEEAASSITGGRLSPEVLGKLMGQMAKDLEASNRETRLAAIRRQLPDKANRTLAFSLAVQVAAADGIVRTSERELLFDLAEGLQLSRDEAADLVKKISG